MSTASGARGNLSGRQPLGDSTTRVNNYATLPTRPTKLREDPCGSSNIPHHESRFPNGNLTNTHNEEQNRGVSNGKNSGSLTFESQRDVKRLSEHSTASTNASGTSKARKTHIGPWRLGPTLGKGATGRVRKARHAVTGQEAAIKIVSLRSTLDMRSKSVIHMDSLFAKKPLRSNQKRIPFGIEREIVIMKVAEHPNIIKVLDVWENRGEMYLVMNLVEGGELFDYIVNNVRLPEIEAVRIFRQILSALAHVHRFLLCHRDIKPENILLDANRNVKIVDFGMAAMQPVGKMLDTSCGSPHYAAPEVAQGLEYSGDLADVWSVGVVLYVMLVGAVPFGSAYDISDEVRGSENLRMILEEVVWCDPHIPKFLSPESRNLLWRMLQKDPAHRISVDQIWSHELIRKYEAYTKHPGYAKKWIGGPPPPITDADCGPQLENRNEIDLDIVDNLCTLWHTDDNELIIESLLDKQGNYVQLLYHRILSSRVEQEENYQGMGVGVSSSDYHHATGRLPKRSATKASLLGPGNRRQQSQFSIAENARRSSMQSRRAISDAGTQSSYDPYRPSKHRFTSPNADFAKITIHRPSENFESLDSTDDRYIIQHPVLSRIQNERNFSRPSSLASNLPTDANGNFRELRRHKVTRNFSKSSFSSARSARSRTSSVPFRRSVSYKKPISFSRSMRSSACETPPPRPRGPSPRNMQRRYGGHCLSSTSKNLPSDILNSPNVSTSPLRSRKEGLYASSSEPNCSNTPKRMSAYLKEEARQVSAELGKFCDDAFNSTPCVSSGGPDDRNRTYPAKLSSHIHKQNKSRNLITDNYRRTMDEQTAEDLLQRPLPDPPLADSYASQELRELEKVRDQVIEQAKTIGKGVLDQVITNFDRLIAQKASELPEDERNKRIGSAPESYSRVKDWLSPVKEEDLVDVISSNRHVSEPVYNSHGKPVIKVWGRETTSIRLVSDDFDPVPQGLTIRKKASASAIDIDQVQLPERNFSTDEDLIKQKPFDAFGKYSHAKNVNSFPCKKEVQTLSPDNFERTYLEAVEEERYKESSVINPAKRISNDSKENKRRGWFQRRSGASQNMAGDEGPPPPVKDSWLVQNATTSEDTYLPTLTMDTSSSAPFSIPQVSTRPRSGITHLYGRPEQAQNIPIRNKFLNFFGRKEPKLKRSSELQVGNDGDESKIASNALTSCANTSTTEELRSSSVRFAEPSANHSLHRTGQNWLARLLHVKPARRVLALQINKARAMKEIRGIFKDWSPYGMCDIKTDKVAGRIKARVDENNTLHIKPVAVAVELFCVLQKGQNASLSIARMYQEHGAKSSFNRVVDTLHGVLRGRNLVVKDKRTAQEMKECLKNWESR